MNNKLALYTGIFSNIAGVLAQALAPADPTAAADIAAGDALVQLAEGAFSLVKQEIAVHKAAASK